jgi:hypothetical protein
MRGENFVAHLDGLGGTPVADHSTMVYYGLLIRRLFNVVVSIAVVNSTKLSMVVVVITIMENW